MKYREPCAKPCSNCPFRRESMPGWLGAGSPESFIDCIQRDEPLPCHPTIDYDDRHWLAKWMAQGDDTGSICAGSLIFMANKLQRPHDPAFPTMKADRETVFSNSIEFVRHHREAAVRSWDDEDQNDGAQLHRKMIADAAMRVDKPIIDFLHKRPSKAEPKRKPVRPKSPVDKKGRLR